MIHQQLLSNLGEFTRLSYLIAPQEIAMMAHSTETTTTYMFINTLIAGAGGEVGGKG